MSYRLVAIYGCDLCGTEIEKAGVEKKRTTTFYGSQQSETSTPSVNYTPPDWGRITLALKFQDEAKKTNSKATGKNCLICPTCREALEETASKLALAAGAVQPQINRRRFKLEEAVEVEA